MLLLQKKPSIRCPPIEFNLNRLFSIPISPGPQPREVIEPL